MEQRMEELKLEMESGPLGVTRIGTGESAMAAEQDGKSTLRAIAAPGEEPVRHRKPEPVSRREKTRKEREGTRHLARYVMLSLLSLMLVAAGSVAYWGYVRAMAAKATYQRITIDVQALETLRSAKFSSYTVVDAARVHDQFVQFQTDVNDLNSQSSLPDWLAPWVHKLPYVGPRYTSARQVIQVVQQLADAGTSASAIGTEVLQAYKTNGLSSNTSPSTPTWLDVLNQQMPQIEAIKGQIEQSLGQISQIDQSVLPAGTRSKLSELNQLAQSHDLNELIDQQLPALVSAFGGDGPARYLVLIQNPSELRPSGGFPGTIAIVTFDRGQLRSYEFYDVYNLNQAYTTNPHDPVPQPWALSKYAPSPELSIPDASWWSNFPTSAATLMKMYQTAGWPPIKGVVALDPAVVGAMLKISGPMTIDVDGEMRTITADNVHDEIERQRRLARDGQKTQDVHKQVVAIIGQRLIEQFKGADRSTTLKMVDAIKQTADSRDLQVYSSDPTVQAMIETHHWAGRLIPNPAKPTIAITFANVAFGKSSELMDPSYTLTLGPVVDGMRSAHLEIKMVHTGSPADDPFYSGFQRWWVDVTLPSGSTRTGSNTPDVSNPDEPNGGSYEIPLMPAATATLSIDFQMPDSPNLTFRRQPGLHTALVTVVDQSCGASTSPRYLTADGDFRLTTICKNP